jgi:cysteine-rich repeat protein
MTTTKGLGALFAVVAAGTLAAPFTGCSSETRGGTDPAAVQAQALTPGKVLILGSTVSSGADSVEAQLAGSGSVGAGELGTLTGLGYTVDVVDNATWSSMTTAQFAAYQAIVLGDATCTSLGVASAAIANTAVWGPAVTGNVILVGTDPVFHYRFTRPDIAQVTYNAIQFAAAKPGFTGAYISLSCYYHGTAPLTPVPLLSPFGSFTVRGVGCYNDAHIVAVHAALAGLTDAILSNWSCSVHEAFDSFPAETFVPLAIARNVGGDGSLGFADGSSGVPYVLARGAIPVRCGDGVVQSPEQCDDGAANGTCGDACSSICQLHWCGDGVVDPGEQCDLGCGNGVTGGTCSADCKTLAVNHPPVAKCANATATADSACTASASVNAGSFDPDPGDTITCSQAPGGPYGGGATNVTLTCTDNHGASSSCTATVTVVDTTAPSIACPSDQLVQTTGTTGTVSFTTVQSDNCGLASVTCTIPPGGSTPLGPTVDTCTVTDTSGNQASCSFGVYTNAPPDAICMDVSVAADAMCLGDGSVNNGSFDPDLDLASCNQSPAGPYALGVDPVTLTCNDTHGASSSCTANVTVADKTPPAIVCPPNQTIECVAGGGAATFAPSATDNCSVTSLGCSPPSGSTFAFGTTQDTCTAGDESGNSSSCGFGVTVSDTLPPTVVTTHQPTELLWPPNHKYQTFRLSQCVTQVTDQCDGTLDIGTAGSITRVTSNEPEDDRLTGKHGNNGNNGDGHTCNDIVILDATSVDLRAERAGGGMGRVYTVFFNVTDSSGNVTASACQVTVPHDQSPDQPTDTACEYCVGSGCGPCPGHDPACTY